MKVCEVQQFGVGNLSFVDRKVPEPKHGQAVVRFHAYSLNYRDIMVIDGTYNPRVKFPFVPFSDGAGEVIAVGQGVTKWKVGDRVSPIFIQQWIDGEITREMARTAIGAGPHWPGVLAEFGAFAETALVRIPDHLSFEEAATLPCTGVTAWHALSGSVKPGDTVLTLGTGGVSVFALQIAKMFGATVISTSSDDAKLERMRELGADHLINYRKREDWDQAVLELTNGRGVDHVIEVGGTGTLARSTNAVRHGGHIALIGALAGSGNFDPIQIFMKSVRAQGIFVGSRKHFEELNRAFAANGSRPVIDRIFEFEQVPDALEYMRNGGHFGKIVVRGV